MRHLFLAPTTCYLPLIIHALIVPNHPSSNVPSMLLLFCPRRNKKESDYTFVPPCAQGYIPLITAVEDGNEEAVKLLLAKGADVLEKGWDGKNALQVSSLQAQPGYQL